jgi:hypothetical protein
MEYRPHLKNSADDFFAASSLGNTVVGVLFEKTGLEIKTAISTRLNLIVKKISDYSSIASKIENFIDEKREILKNYDSFYQSRRDEREALLIPYRRSIEEVIKKCKDVTFSFDRESYKQISSKALTFEDGFDEAEVHFKEVDEFLKMEEDIVKAVLEASSSGFSGLSGYSGLSGTSGYSGIGGFSGSESGEKENLEEIVHNYSPTLEDEAYSKMCTMRSILIKYFEKLEMIKRVIKKLELEHRRLDLIMKNIVDDRSYKLDLIKLSALGFEDFQ